MIVAEQRFGSVDSCELHLRWVVPMSFIHWDGALRFSLRSLLNPARWWRAMRCGDNWRFRCRRHLGCTHRCYCDDGSSIDGELALCGFAIQWFYSHFTGSIPCWCDKVYADLIPDGERVGSLEADGSNGNEN